ncbi:PfkB family carbohydrate kinase [Ferrovum myxofaciens]|uniref:diguanylate cyclase n=1 Tax=Ferrovum myxofaciens TaxID=416213 RepID=A0A9E6SY08_9PROT|nr:PfkB family carbohydrate kinase [Ferrovum myxofaciens]QKE37339.1 MAG: diguanylate cyclase [Ferrovum myxofaciens]QWY74987.1 MAG: diguanylate cyclase [Ferrovum myxofaciens]QWY77735.1 MAG: diguanylate cyclase [Ferrovum myxofaciens]
MILVAGSAHLDILSRTSVDDDSVDKIGSVSISIGGCAGNIATNIAEMGGEARLLTAMNQSAYSRIIESHLVSLGVEPIIVSDPTLPLAAFVAHINSKGELVSAISSMPVDRVEFSENALTHAFAGIDAVIAECNLSETNLLKLAKAATDAELPFYIGGVSESKVCRVLTLAGTGFVTALFCNMREAVRLLDYSGCDDYLELASVIGGNFVVTQGAEGVKIFNTSGMTIVQGCSIQEVTNGNHLGAGDMLMASTIHNHIAGVPFPLAIEMGTLKTENILARQNCSLGAPDAMEKIISQNRHQSLYDGLTGLLNRRATLSVAESMIALARRSGRSVAVMIFDIDHFKGVNDTWGHDAGDEVLKQVAQVTTDTLRESDIVGRWGGEEFVCAMIDANLDAAFDVANRLRQRISEQVTEPKIITISGGIVMLEHGENISSAITRADALLYDAKHGGRNQIRR